MRIKRIAHGPLVYTVGDAWPEQSTKSLLVAEIAYSTEQTIESEGPVDIDELTEYERKKQAGVATEEDEPVGEPVTEREIACYAVTQLPAALLLFYEISKKKLLSGKPLDTVEIAQFEKLAKEHPAVLVRKIFRDRVAVQIEDQEYDTSEFFESAFRRIVEEGRAIAEAEKRAENGARPQATT